jgi:hypothetical protein
MTKPSASLYNGDSSHSFMEEGSTSPSFHAETGGKSLSSWRWDQIARIAFLSSQVVLALTALYQLKHDPSKTAAMTDSMQDEQPWFVQPWSEKHNVSDLSQSLSTVDEALSTHSNIQMGVKEYNKDDHPCWYLWRLFSSNNISNDNGEAYPSDDGNGVQRHHHHHGKYDTVADDDYSDDIGAEVQAPVVLEEDGKEKALRWVRWSLNIDLLDHSNARDIADSVDSEDERSSVLGWFWFSKPLSLATDVRPSDDSNGGQRHHHHHGNYNTVTDDDFSDDIGR